MHGAAGIQRHVDVGRSAAGRDQHVLAEIDGEGQHLAGAVGAVGGCCHRGHRRRYRIHQHTRGCGHVVEGQHRIIGSGVLHGAAVEQDGAADRNAVAGAFP